MPDNSFAELKLSAYRGKYVLLFFYPMDFTFVCPSEIIAFDKEGVVRHALVNDLPLGRNVDEALRVLDALQYIEKHGEVCPANWKKGKDAMKPTVDGLATYLAKHMKQS